MMKITNKKIGIEIIKDGELLKSYTFKNNLTDLLLDSITYNQLPSAIASTLYPTLSTITSDPFDRVYFDFQTPKITIDVDTISVSGVTIYQNIDENNSTITYGEKTKISKIQYTPVLLEGVLPVDAPTDKLQHLIFGSTSKISAFIDVSDLNIYLSSDVKISVFRYDQVESNETGLETLSSSADYLPKLQSALNTSGEIDNITLCFGENGTGEEYDYEMADLSFSLLGTGEIEVSGFDDFHYETTPLQPSETLQPSLTLQPTQEASQINSVKFTYSNGTQTYVNIKDLDISYDEGTITMKLKCERGDY